MSNSLRVVNEGLVRLGVPPLASLSDQSAQAMVVEQIYDRQKRTALANFPWPFALRERKLERINVASQDEEFRARWSYTYQMPNNVIRVLGLHEREPFYLSRDRLHTNARKARLVYVEDVGEQNWPEYFQTYVALKVAAALAISLTDTSARADRMYEEARLQERQARVIASAETPPEVFETMRIYARPGYNFLAVG